MDFSLDMEALNSGNTKEEPVFASTFSQSKVSLRLGKCENQFYFHF